MKKVFLQVSVLVGFGFVVGVALNRLSPNPLPLIAGPDQFEIAIDETQNVHSTEILDLWESGEALFIDARSEDAFAKGHIPGAFSVPYTSFEDGPPEIVDYLPQDQTIIVYCDGADCHASQVVHDKLVDLGFPDENLKIFHGGWNDWLELGGKIEKEED